MKRPFYLAGFDSATTMFQTTARYLHGEDTPMVGLGSKVMAYALAPVGRGVNALPRGVREKLYALSGWGGAIPPEQLCKVRAEDVSKWMTSEIPERRYPAVAIGSSNGAMTHLYAALGIPWLPQTFLIPVRRHGVHPDEPKRDLEKVKAFAGPLLEANPELQLHHMHDGNQDRLMIQYMTYFRVKRLALGKTLERFLERSLEPGGTILLTECTLKWPTLKVDERYIFQHGGLGGATKEEFERGSERVADYLARYGSHRRSWDPPEPDGERPEAEWGFEPALREDVLRFAGKHGYRVKRLTFEQPEHLSPLVADFYRAWYKQRELVANRLLVESFALHTPFWALRTGSVPFWMVFNTEPSAAALEDYLKSRDPFNEINLALLSHGVDSVGLVPIEAWERLLRHARKEGRFIGVDAEAFPRDFAVYARYYTELKRQIRARYPLPGPLPLERLETFIREKEEKYSVAWRDA